MPVLAYKNARVSLPTATVRAGKDDELNVVFKMLLPVSDSTTLTIASRDPSGPISIEPRYHTLVLYALLTLWKFGVVVPVYPRTVRYPPCAVTVNPWLGVLTLMLFSQPKSAWKFVSLSNGRKMKSNLIPCSRYIVVGLLAKP